MPRFGKTSIIIKNETDKNDPSMNINFGSCVINRYLAAYRVATTTYCRKQLYTCKQTTKSQTVIHLCQETLSNDRQQVT